MADTSSDPEQHDDDNKPGWFSRASFAVKYAIFPLWSQIHTIDMCYNVTYKLDWYMYTQVYTLHLNTCGKMVPQ